MRIAFHAPLKPPTHPTPSGDRRMARLLMRALDMAGHQVALASEFRSYEGSGSVIEQDRLRRLGEREAERIIKIWLKEPKKRPDLWFTYHVYHKAPDWLGPKISEFFGLPYVIAEPSHAPKQAGGLWDMGYVAAKHAIESADRLFCMTHFDEQCLKPLVEDRNKLIFLPPFIEGNTAPVGLRTREIIAGKFCVDANARWLLVAAMMRFGHKLESYKWLARVLNELPGSDWQLLVAGDGPARLEVREAFTLLGERVIWMGELQAQELNSLYSNSDLYIWPGIGEAYGMAFLEAQEAALPVVAGRYRGIPDVVEDGITGILVDPSDTRGFVSAIRELLDNREKLMKMRILACEFVKAKRSVESAADIFRNSLT